MYANAKNAANSNAQIDLRSDTVTRPGAEMRAVMAAAPVGDDVYGEDPSIAELEASAAALLGKEAACFFATGTQSNLAALLSHCGRGEEYIAGDRYHIYTSEAAGAAVLGGISPCALPTTPAGALSADQVLAAVKPDDSHYAISRLLCLENSVWGRVLPLQDVAAPAAAARAAGLKVHLDGARYFNATVALGLAPDGLASEVDSVSICLSKGLGAPVGSLLLGEADFIEKARRNRKLLGGGMRQAGILAAAGSYALEHNRARLAEDHARAKRLAEALAALPGLEVDPQEVDSNMVFVTPRPGSHTRLESLMAERGIAVSMDQTLRLVLHLDVDDAKLEAVIAAFQDFARLEAQS